MEDVANLINRQAPALNASLLNVSLVTHSGATTRVIASRVTADAAKPNSAADADKAKKPGDGG